MMKKVITILEGKKKSLKLMKKVMFLKNSRQCSEIDEKSNLYLSFFSIWKIH